MNASLISVFNRKLLFDWALHISWTTFSFYWCNVLVLFSCKLIRFWAHCCPTLVYIVAMCFWFFLRNGLLVSWNGFEKHMDWSFWNLFSNICSFCVVRNSYNSIKFSYYLKIISYFQFYLKIISYFRFFNHLRSFYLGVLVFGCCYTNLILLFTIFQPLCIRGDILIS